MKLPFDEEFLLSVPVRHDMVAVDLSLLPRSGKGPRICGQRLKVNRVANDPKTVIFAVSVLPPNQDYDLNLSYWLKGATPLTCPQERYHFLC